MARLLAFNAIFFLVPFVLYAGWLAVARGSISNVADWQGRTIARLALGGAAVMFVALVIFTSFKGAPPGGTYRPAKIENGQIVPGKIE
jgi:hypothetical protein